MTCQCLTWCRVPEEPNTYGGRFPMSDHHPNCPAYRAEEFAVVECDGAKCVVPGDSAAIQYLMDGTPPEEYTVTRYMLAQDQVDKLPEFTGF